MEEIVAYGRKQRSWLIFYTKIDHAFHVRDAVRARGIPCETIVGDTPSDEREALVEAFKRGAVRCLTNANVLTTGFNAPAVDGLDAGEEHLGADLAALQSRRVDARGGLGPQAKQLRVVLGDELTHVGHDQQALVGVGLEHPLDEGGHDQGFAAGGRQGQERISLLVHEVVVDRPDCCGLIRS